MADDDVVLVTLPEGGVALFERGRSGWAGRRLHESGTWPAWNPVRDLVAIGRDGGTDGGGLDLVDLSGGAVGSLHRPQARSVSGQSEANRSLSCWSPGGDVLSYVAAGDHGRTLFLSHADGDFTANPIINVADGAAIWTRWCTDNNFLAVHAGRELLVVETQGSRWAAEVAPSADGFRAAAYSDDAEILSYVMSDRAGALSLMRALFQGTGSRPVHRFSGAIAALDFRPETQELAVALCRDMTGGRFESLSVIDLGQEGAGPVCIRQRPFSAFWWSPAGDRLAVLAVDSAGVASVEVIDPGGATIGISPPFRPSPDYLLAAESFDHAGQAHPFWSADGGSFLLAGAIEGAVQPGSQIARWTPGAGSACEWIGPGRFAVFRPRRKRIHG